ncbi:MAG: hypothetical protein Q8P67_00325, partial [archaeon]|nr:hypothetical protein [archaeon]
QKIFDDESRCFEILDTAGGWEDTSLRNESYHRYPHYLIVYAINSRASFDEVDSIAESIMRVRGVEWLPSTVVLGNKSDLEEERQVSVVAGQQKARKYRTRFMETSAKDRINIDEAFHLLLQPWNSLSRQTPLLEQVMVTRSGRRTTWRKGWFGESVPKMNGGFVFNIVREGQSGEAGVGLQCICQKRSSFLCHPRLRPLLIFSHSEKKYSGAFSVS